MGDRQVTKSADYRPREESSSQAYQGTVSSHSQSTATGQSQTPSTSTNTSSQFQQHRSQQEAMPTRQFNTGQTQGPNSQSVYNMVGLANALPTQVYHSGFVGVHHHNQQHRYASDVQHPNIFNQASSVHQYPGQPYYMHPQHHMPSYFGHQQVPGAQGHQLSQTTGLARANNNFYPDAMMVNQNNPAGYYYHPQMPMFSGTAGQSQLPQSSLYPGLVQGGGVQNSQPKSAPQPGSRETTIEYPDGSNSAQFSVVRGPPRKPRQSGHAIWIGNLPPQTDLMNLVRHVCRETPGLESLFLISKSSCAFANFKSEESCIAAQQKLHDSKFQSVRLVSRLRKSTVEGASGQTAPTGPASSSPSVNKPTPMKENTPKDEQKQDGAVAKENIVQLDPKSATSPDRVFLKDRFFVLKSLTVEDLELSVRNGVWATQSHNEDNLNKAFMTADNVYLVFSANKSGEYFGYARMTSPINNDPAAAIKFAPKVQPTDQMDVPQSIITDPTDDCPKGRIIDDSSRGTIFWEIDRGDEETAESEAGSETSVGLHDLGENDEETKAWGKPFKLEWQSTTKLPFYRTRGLRNVWNSNRDVKIARDGTELETSVGKKLIGLFNRHQSPAPHLSVGFRQDIQMISGYPLSYR